MLGCLFHVAVYVFLGIMVSALCFFFFFFLFFFLYRERKLVTDVHTFLSAVNNPRVRAKLGLVRSGRLKA